ncbi:MAG: NAD(P)/FAD-dependent oxidoreductase [Rubricoccaceae bacterium]
MPDSPSLLIVGAGAAGLSAAFALRDHPIRVTVVEKSRGVSGRAATRWREVETDAGTARWRYDHGAQYASPMPESRAATLLRDTLPSHDLHQIEGAVWPFDDDGTLRPDRVRPDAGMRWTYPDGIAEIGRRLRDAMPGLDLRMKTRVGKIQKDGAQWEAVTDDGLAIGHGFDAVLLTAPAPQAADLLDSGPRDLVDALAAASYRSQFSVMWGFQGVLERPGAFYALVNATEHGETTGGHDVAWLAFESDKPNRAPEGSTLLLAQMSPAWTQAHYSEDRSDVVAAATRAVESLIGALPAPLWTDTQRWRYALPDASLSPKAIETAAAMNLFIAGDATAEKGRVHLALEEGLGVADRIVRQLEDGRRRTEDGGR